MIGTVSTDEKAELARSHGAGPVAVYSREDFVPLVMEVTDGKGCPAVYDSIGKDTFNGSPDCLQPLGVLACYGYALRAPDPVEVIELGARGSLFVTRPAIMHYVEVRENLIASAHELFDVMASGAVTVTARNRLSTPPGGRRAP